MCVLHVPERSIFEILLLIGLSPMSWPMALNTTYGTVMLWSTTYEYTFVIILMCMLSGQYEIKNNALCEEASIRLLIRYFMY